MTWHDIKDPKDPELDRLASQYKIHPLHIEDCRSRNQRAKVEDGADYLFVVLKPVWAVGDELESDDLDLFLGQDWVITVQEGHADGIAELLKPLQATEKSLRAEQIFYRVMDIVVDSYMPVLNCVDDIIDDLEEKVLSDPTPDLLSRIFTTKRNLVDLRRILVNTQDLVAHLYRTDHNLISKDLIPFLRDVYDHVTRNRDLIETQRDLLNGTMDVYLSSVANKTNQVMKVLTVLGTIALPVLVISGFYGMNTKGLPFAEAPHATLMIGGVMMASTVGLLLLLRWFRWF